MKIYSYLSIGTGDYKEEMEDRILLGKNILVSGYHEDLFSSGIFGVFDGLGGVAGSAFASSLAANILSKVSVSASAQEIKDTIEKIHKELFNGTRTATTATGIVIRENHNAVIFHVGNTRISVLRGGYIVPVTTDQTNFEMLLQKGFEEENISQNMKGVLTSCLGGNEEMISGLEVREIPDIFRDYSRILITSDGIHDYLSLDDMEVFLKGEAGKESFLELVKKARENGSEDDVSILLIEA